jgi:hypothetical protein
MADEIETEEGDCAWIWVHWSARTSEGLVFHHTGWSEDCHWTGERTIPLSDPTFPFWEWLWSNRKALPNLLNSADLDRAASSGNFDTSVTLVAPHDGIYITREVKSNNPEFMTRIQALLDKLKLNSWLRIIEDTTSSEKLLWDTLMGFSDCQIFVYVRGQCSTAGMNPEADIDSQTYALKRIEDSLTDLNSD